MGNPCGAPSRATETARKPASLFRQTERRRPGLRRELFLMTCGQKWVFYASVMRIVDLDGSLSTDLDGLGVKWCIYKA